MDWKLEVVVVPVTDVDRAKKFYSEQVGFNVDVDRSMGVHIDQHGAARMRSGQRLDSAVGDDGPIDDHISSMAAGVIRLVVESNFTGGIVHDFECVESRHAGIKARLVKEEKLHRFINVYVNDEDVRFAGGLEAEVKDGDTLTILPAVAGG